MIPYDTHRLVLFGVGYDWFQICGPNPALHVVYVNYPRNFGKERFIRVNYMVSSISVCSQNYSSAKQNKTNQQVRTQQQLSKILSLSVHHLFFAGQPISAKRQDETLTLANVCAPRKDEAERAVMDSANCEVRLGGSSFS